jgi:hypothetical protein
MLMVPDNWKSDDTGEGEKAESTADAATLTGR